MRLVQTVNDPNIVSSPNASNALHMVSAGNAKRNWAADGFSAGDGVDAPGSRSHDAPKRNLRPAAFQTRAGGLPEVKPTGNAVIAASG